MRPHPEPAARRANSADSRAGPRTLAARWSSSCSSVRSRKLVGAQWAALLTRIDAGPNAACTASSRRPAAPADLRSSVVDPTAPRARSSFSSAAAPPPASKPTSRSYASKCVKKILAPRSASRRQMAAPMPGPRLAPVTMATRPARSRRRPSRSAPDPRMLSRSSSACRSAGRNARRCGRPRGRSGRV